MVEYSRGGESDPPRENSEPENLDRAIAEVAHLRQSLLTLGTPNARLAEIICLAQIILLTEDRQQVSRDTSGQPYSADQEAIAVLFNAIKSLKQKRDNQIADAIKDLDPDER
jgi:hypothetical protein